MGEGELDVRLAPGQESIERFAARIGVVDRAPELGEPLLDHRHHQLVAVGEVQVDRGRRDADLGGHAADRELVRVASAVEERGRRPDELVT
jgi:hypothetical protein